MPFQLLKLDQVDDQSFSSFSEASLGKEREKVDTSQKYGNEAGESDINNSTRSSGHIDTNTSLQAPENTTPGMLASFLSGFIVNLQLLIISKASIKKKESDEDEEEEPVEEDIEDDSNEDDSDDDFPKFEGYVKFSLIP